MNRKIFFISIMMMICIFCYYANPFITLVAVLMAGAMIFVLCIMGLDYFKNNFNLFLLIIISLLVAISLYEIRVMNFHKINEYEANQKITGIITGVEKDGLVLSRVNISGCKFNQKLYVKLDFSSVPICIEADNNAFRSTLIKFANELTNSVWIIDSEQRKQLHIAAVFACNFVNHLYSLSERLIAEKKIDFTILHPLMQATVNKAINNSPQIVQTGPAKRNDKNTIEKHLGLLSSQPDLKMIYEILTNSIKKFHNYKG